MQSEIAALLDKPLLLILILGIGAASGVLVERIAQNLKKAERRAYWKGRNTGKGRFKPKLKTVPTKGGEFDTTDLAAEQLRTVMKAGFKQRALLNKPERRLLGVIDQALVEHSPGWRAMGQVSLGEVLASKNRDAYFAINSKRVDLLIVDQNCKPLHAVEFQGTGHHGSAETAARDAVKKEALRRAGIGYVEVVSGDTPAEVRSLVKKLVGRTMA